MFFFGDEDFLVVFMRDTKSFSFSSDICLILEVGSRWRVFLHVPFHPIRVLFLPTETKACSFEGVGLEACINAVGWLSIVLGVVIEPICFGNAIDQDSFLEGAGTLFIENSLIEENLRSPQFEWKEERQGRLSDILFLLEDLFRLNLFNFTHYSHRGEKVIFQRRWQNVLSSVYELWEDDRFWMAHHRQPLLKDFQFSTLFLPLLLEAISCFSISASNKIIILFLVDLSKHFYLGLWIIFRVSIHGSKKVQGGEMF